MKKLLLSLFICFQIAAFAQTKGMRTQGMKCETCPVTPKPVFKTASTALTATIATHYTMSACGLNYVQVSKALFQRSFSPFPMNPVQPVTYNVSGIPPCATVLKAFLYAGVLGSGTTAVTATITNPSPTTLSFPMAISGGDADLCWGFAGSFTYRADVTSAITGNGNYQISGIPASSVFGEDDAEGATLFIIYSDPSQSYTGNIVIADGCQINTNPCSSQISGFNVCGAPSVTEHFMLLADMQQGADAELSFNTLGSTPNHTVLSANQNVWDFVSGPGAPATIGQTSAEYGIFTIGDCIGMMMAGMYFQTECLTCASMINAVASTTTCPATATVYINNVTGPYTYSWTPSAQTTSVATLGTGTYTVGITAQNGCTGSATLNVSAPAPTIAITKPSVICKGTSGKLIAGGTSTSFSWSPATYLNVTNAATVIVTPTATGSVSYTLNYTNAQGCTNKAITIVNISACTGIEDVVSDEFKLLVYPNPSSGNFTVESKTPMNLLLVNAMGQIVKSVELNSKNNNHVSVTGLAEGVYYFISKDRSQSIKQKIVVGK